MLRNRNFLRGYKSGLDVLRANAKVKNMTCAFDFDGYIFII